MPYVHLDGVVEAAEAADTTEAAEGQAAVNLLGLGTEVAAVPVVVAVVAKLMLLRQTTLLTEKETRGWGWRYVTFAGGC